MTVNVPPLNVTTNLPPDVVDKLAPHHSVGDWLYSQGATVLVAVVALGAAYLAWRAVRRQIGAAGAQQVQLLADAERLKAQIDAENRRQQRKERLDALTDAAVVATEIWHFAFQNVARRDDAEVLRDTIYINLKVSTVKARFDLLRMPDQGDAVKDLWEGAQRANNIGTATALGQDYKSLLGRTDDSDRRLVQRRHSLDLQPRNRIALVGQVIWRGHCGDRPLLVSRVITPLTTTAISTTATAMAANRPLSHGDLRESFTMALLPLPEPIPRRERFAHRQDDAVALSGVHRHRSQ